MTLIERLSNATGPDRDLDAAIDAALRVGNDKLPPWAWKNFPRWAPGPTTGRCMVLHDNGNGGIHWESRQFTSSIDAALTLNPYKSDEGWWGVDQMASPTSPMRHFGGRDGLFKATVSPWDTSRSKASMAWHDVPAIALCIAALRARSHGEDDKR
jgi:hypothetical protein